MHSYYDTKFSVPLLQSMSHPYAKAKHDLFKTFWKNNVLVTSCHAVFDGKTTNAWKCVENRHLQRFVIRKRHLTSQAMIYKIAISYFRNLVFLTPQKIKKIFFWFFFSKTKTNYDIEKPGIYVTDLRCNNTIPKFQSNVFIFGWVMAPQVNEAYDVIFSN